MSAHLLTYLLYFSPVCWFSSHVFLTYLGYTRRCSAVAAAVSASGTGTGHLHSPGSAKPYQGKRDPRCGITSTFCRAHSSWQVTARPDFSSRDLVRKSASCSIFYALHGCGTAFKNKTVKPALGLKLRDKACKPQTAVKAVPLDGFQLPTA